jgi:hypothetical protein
LPAPEDSDAIRRLEERLTRASQAAERLIHEAAESVAGSDRPPPMGWQQPPRDPGGGADGDRRREDMALLLELAGRVRDLVPPDLQRRLAEALRELLLALRAVVDWYLDRLDQRRREPPEVTDIPID